MHQPVEVTDLSDFDQDAILETLCAQYVVSLMDRGFDGLRIADAMHYAASALDAEAHGHCAPDAIM